MDVVLEIIRILIFVSWITFILYTYFRFKKEIKDLANRYDIRVPFQCKECHSIYNYPYETYLRIVKRIRKEYSARFGSGIHRSREYKCPCEKCGTNQWQKQLQLFPFSGSACQAQYRNLLIKMAVKLFAGSFLVVFGMSILD